MASKFIIQDKPDINSFIKLLKCEVTANNNVLITWEWPKDNNIKLVVVFCVTAVCESLQELLESSSNAVIITKGMEGSYNKPLENEKAIFKLYPACFGKNGEVVILNQSDGNTTDTLYAKIPVYYSINYKSIPFSQLQKVFIKVEIAPQQKFLPNASINDLLLYEKIISGYTLRYPLDESAVTSGITLYTKKNEQIYIKPKAPYENIVSLHKEV